MSITSTTPVVFFAQTMHHLHFYYGEAAFIPFGSRQTVEIIDSDKFSLEKSGLYKFSLMYVCMIYASITLRTSLFGS